MKAWSAFHDLLCDSNSNKLDKKLRCTILKSQSYDRAKHLVKSVSQADLTKDEGWKSAINTIYKIEPLHFVSDVNLDYNSLLSTRRRQNGNVRNLKTRFWAQVSRFNSHNAGSIPDSFVAFMLLSNSNIDGNQTVSILAAVVIHVNPVNNAEPTVPKTPASVKYASIDFVLRQCGRKRTNVTHGIGDALNTNEAHGVGDGKYRGNFRQYWTPAEIAERKKKMPFQYS